VRFSSLSLIEVREMTPQSNPIIHLNQDIGQARMRDDAQQGLPQRFDGRWSRSFLVLGQIQVALPSLVTISANSLLSQPSNTAWNVVR
jgi:hypothetical protein